MNESRALYQEIIIDHGRHPRHFGKLANATHQKEGYNPLCGDKLHLYLTVNNNLIEDIMFEGEGCAISMASASLLAQKIKGKTIKEAEALFNSFHTLLTESTPLDTELLGKLAVLAGVREYPARVKCATLAWHTLMSALHNDPTHISTESL